MFIAIDGIDGAGKTTLAQQLAELLGQLDPIRTKEPTDTSHWGQRLRTAAVEGRLPRDKELEFFRKDRLCHIEKLIQPALEEDRLVITDRYVDSTLAYQAHTVDEANELYQSLLPEIIVPDVTFILACPVQIGLERLQKRDGNNFSQFENGEALDRAARIYESRCGENYEILDASGSAENTLHQAVHALVKRFSHLSKIIKTVNPLPPNLNGLSLLSASE